MPILKRILVVLAVGVVAAIVVTTFVVVRVSTQPLVASPGIYTSDSAEINYTGAWRTLTPKVPDASTGRQAISGASLVSFTFDGQAIQWITRLTPDAGSVDIRVDDQPVKTVSLQHDTAVEEYVGYRNTDLDPGRHTISISVHSSSPAATLFVDSFRVASSSAPDAVSGFSAEKTDRGVDLTWSPGDDPQISNYRVYAAAGPTAAFTAIGTIDASETEYLFAQSSTTTTTYRFQVVAVDFLGRESTDSTTSEVTVAASRVPSYPTIDECPSATVTVHDSDSLARALEAPKAGTVIRLKPGTYDGAFVVSEAAGTESDPVWICGSTKAVLDGGDVSASLYGLHVVDSSYVVVAGMTVTNSRKGIMVDNSEHITVSNTTVRGVGEEGIHLRSNTTDSMVAGNSVSSTGLKTPKWGEGIYVGSAYGNWCSLTGCQPDGSSRNVISDNTIFETTAEAVDIKEGALDGSITWNDINHDGAVDTDRWINIRSNGWYIADNEGSSDIGGNGIQVYAPPPRGYGVDNVVVRNTATFTGQVAGFAVNIESKGNTVGCDNSYVGNAAGLTNVTCQP